MLALLSLLIVACIIVFMAGMLIAMTTWKYGTAIVVGIIVFLAMLFGGAWFFNIG